MATTTTTWKTATPHSSSRHSHNVSHYPYPPQEPHLGLQPTVSSSSQQGGISKSAATHGGAGSHTWRLWRNCCCRYGWYPLLVAPLVTAACILSLYSAGGCDFVRVNVGFTPTNVAWNQTEQIQVGLFLYQSGQPDSNRYRAAFLEGCREYSDEFVDSFVEDDRTWMVARIMAYVAGGASVVASVRAVHEGMATRRLDQLAHSLTLPFNILFAQILSWLFVISPLPTFFFWPGVMLPCLLAAFLAEGSKFLFFDTALCRNNVWFPSGSESSPQVAEECTLGVTGKYAIAAGALFFCLLLLVCLQAPEKRKLDPNYGYDIERSNHQAVMNESRQTYGYTTNMPSDYDPESDDFDRTTTISDRDHYAILRPFSPVGDDESYLTTTSKGQTDSEYESGVEYGLSMGEIREDDETLISQARLGSLDAVEDRYAERPLDDSDSILADKDDDRYNPKKPHSTVTMSRDEKPLVSESRLSTVEKMQMQSTSESKLMIDKFVTELDASFQVSGKQKQSSATTKTEASQTEEASSSTPALADSTTSGSGSSKENQPIEQKAVVAPPPPSENTFFQTLCAGQESTVSS